MNNKLKVAMREWVNLPPDEVERTFVKYTSFAKRNARMFYNAFFNPLCEHADEVEALLIEQLEINNILTGLPTQRIKSVIDVSGEIAEQLEIRRSYMLPDGLAVEVIGSSTPAIPNSVMVNGIVYNKGTIELLIRDVARLSRAIELLEACSEDLFLGFGDDVELEVRVDEFIKEVTSC